MPGVHPSLPQPTTSPVGLILPVLVFFALISAWSDWGWGWDRGRGAHPGASPKFKGSEVRYQELVVAKATQLPPAGPIALVLAP